MLVKQADAIAEDLMENIKAIYSMETGNFF